MLEVASQLGYIVITSPTPSSQPAEESELRRLTLKVVPIRGAAVPPQAFVPVEACAQAHGRDGTI